MAGPAVEVRVSRELAVVARELKSTGDKSLRRQVQRGLRNGARPVIAAAREAARDRLPKAHGLNEQIANAKWSVRTNLGAAHPTVRVVSRRGQAIDDGILRHPVFGHKDRWVTQHVTPHIQTDAMRGAAPDVREHLLAAVDEWARRLT